MSHPLIELQNVTRQYTPEIPSGVKNVSVTIRKGGVTAIIGESGSGKSTLLKLIYGLLAPDEGELLYEGAHIKGPDEKLIPGHDAMKMVSQDFSLNIYAKAYDNIAALLPNTDVSAKQQRTLEIMELLRIEHLRNKRAVDLSGGEQQRVAIARAVITRPEVILLDEPFSQVDAILKSQLRADIKSLSTQLGITIIMVTHDPADALSMADELWILEAGRLLEAGTPKQLYYHPRYSYTARLLAGSNILSQKQAAAMGIDTYSEEISIRPDQLVLSDNTSSGNLFTVKQQLFKGFYYELILENSMCRLKVITPNEVVAGTCVAVEVSGYTEHTRI